MDAKHLEELVREAIKQLSVSGAAAVPAAQSSTKTVADQLNPEKDYPLAEKRAELIRTATGKRLEELTMDNVLNNSITPQDVRITPESLSMQAQIAQACGRVQLAKNFRRAAELTRVPDERILEIYTALRPYRSTKEELLAIADELENKFDAKINAAFVLEAAEVYERRGRLRTA